jgi:anti-sigma regulatory factor (Ser/Thr protein kinase)
MKASSRQKLADKDFPARLDQLGVIADFITEVARGRGMGDRDVFAVQMAVDEAVTNVITLPVHRLLAGGERPGRRDSRPWPAF